MTISRCWCAMRCNVSIQRCHRETLFLNVNVHVYKITIQCGIITLADVLFLILESSTVESSTAINY